MARGGYWIGDKGAAEFAEALKATGGEMKELRAVHLRIAKLAEENVRRNVPIYGGSSKDSKAHKGTGYLRSIVKGGASGMRSWVRMKDESGVLILQEFGGKSFWTSAGAGALRALNTSHRAVRDLGGGDIGWEESYSIRGKRAARGYSRSVRVSGHIVYQKPRKPRGYFIWNVAYHMRQEIGEEYCRGMKLVAEKHDLIYDIAISPSLDIKPDSWGG